MTFHNIEVILFYLHIKKKTGGSKKKKNVPARDEDKDEFPSSPRANFSHFVRPSIRSCFVWVLTNRILFFLILKIFFSQPHNEGLIFFLFKCFILNCELKFSSFIFRFNPFFVFRFLWLSKFVVYWIFLTGVDLHLREGKVRMFRGYIQRSEKPVPIFFFFQFSHTCGF